MLKTEHWAILLTGVWMCFFVVFFWHSILTSNQIDESKNAERILIEAEKGALAEASYTGANIFSEEETRERVIEKFKLLVDEGYGLQGVKANDTDFMIPATFLVDNEGYYVNYSRLVDNGHGTDELVNITSGLNTWTKTYGRYRIQYSIDDVVLITKDTGESEHGSFVDVYKKFGKPTDISFVNPDDDDATLLKKFEPEHRDVVCTIMQDQINYYITTHNKYLNRDNRAYKFTMPEADTFDSRLMDRPSIISFIQGSQYSTPKGHINAFALTGAIRDKEKTYFIAPITSDPTHQYYHEGGCSEALAPSSNKKLSMKECAKRGALPCPSCVK